MTACFGDSITAGRPGVSYLRYFKNKKDYLNFGLGGDTLLGLSERVGRFLQRSPCNEFIIEIGANDILLPFLREDSGAWRGVVDRITARGSVPLSSKADFAEEYEKLLSRLSGRRVKAISIPCIGEDLKSDLNAKADEYNECIRNLCLSYGITYIDFNQWQKEIIMKTGMNDCFISKNPLGIVMDSLLTTHLGFSQWLSRKRRLVLTVDGIHLNEDGAEGLARLIEEI